MQNFSPERRTSPFLFISRCNELHSLGLWMWKGQCALNHKLNTMNTKWLLWKVKTQTAFPNRITVNNSLCQTESVFPEQKPRNYYILLERKPWRKDSFFGYAFASVRRGSSSRTYCWCTRVPRELGRCCRSPPNMAVPHDKIWGYKSVILSE